jgi:hypothetical protein
MSEKSPLLTPHQDPEQGRLASHASLIQSEVQPSSIQPPNQSKVTWPFLLLLLSLSLFLGILTLWIRVDSDRKYHDMQIELFAMHSRLDAVESQSNARFYLLEQKELTLEAVTDKKIHDLDTNYSKHFSSLSSIVDSHEKELVRLSNGTTNADVLDKLKATKEEVGSALEETKEEVSNSLQTVQRNVSEQVAASQRALDSTQQAVSQHLNATLGTVNKVVYEATSHIHEVRHNVSVQLEGMNQQLSRTVAQLSDAVDSAQDTIRSEVNVVQASIEQYVAITNKQFAAENDFVKYQIAGTFTLLSTLIFLAHITSHARHYHKPDAQRRIMAVLWMVPVYGITSWISLLKPACEPFLGALRDLVEAYVVYSFVGLLVAVLGDGLSFDQLIDKLAHHVAEEQAAVEQYGQCRREGSLLPNAPRPVRHLSPPCPCCYTTQAEAVAKAWLWQCQFLAMQFVFVKPLSTFLPYFLRACQLYDMDALPPWDAASHRIDWHAPKLYLLVVQNLSVALAFAGLLSLFHGVEQELEWCSPWPKFLCIKGVVFATFWQALVIQAMSAYGLVDERTASQCQNLLICIEMLIASVAHLYVFPHQEWAPSYRHERQRSLLLRDTMALGDFYRDMRRLVTPWGHFKEQELGTLSGRSRKGSKSKCDTPEETASLSLHTPQRTSSFSLHRQSCTTIMQPRDNAISGEDPGLHQKSNGDDSFLLHELRTELILRLDLLSQQQQQGPEEGGAVAAPSNISASADSTSPYFQLSQSNEYDSTCMEFKEAPGSSSVM